VTITDTNGVSLGFCETSCNVKYNCPSGQTCWTKDELALECMSSGPLQAGATCALILESADGPACVAAGNPKQGQCDHSRTTQ
jgi:hypothetical protein